MSPDWIEIGEIFPEWGPVGSPELEEGELPPDPETEVQEYSEDQEDQK